MSAHPYYLVDVFTDQKFGGNPLAVFPKGQHIPEEKMQLLAKEFNLSETTFVFPPEDPKNDYKIRIFTPQKELPMAGHPTIGTAYVLATAKNTSKTTCLNLRLEENVGLIPVEVTFDKDVPGIITMTQPKPVFMEICENRALVAGAVGLHEEDLIPKLPCQAVSTAVPTLFIPLKTRAATKRAKVNSSALDLLIDEIGTFPLYLFDTEMDNLNDVHGRMFAPHFGIPEDPATGGANGPLGAYLVKHKVLPEGRILSEQGIEMGRPSILELTIKVTGTEISKVAVGGKCVLVGKGEIYL